MIDPTRGVPSIAAIRAALALCDSPEDRELPQTLTDALAVRDRIAAFPPGLPEAGDLIQTLAAVDPADFDTTFDEVSAEYARRAFIAATRTNGLQGIATGRRIAAAYAEAAPVIAERLGRVFTRAAGELTKATAKLPEGPAALDPAAVLDANAGSPYKTAHAAVQTLHTLAQAVHVPLRVDNSTPPGSAVVAVVDVPAVGVERAHPISERRLNDSDELEQIYAVRRLVEAYRAAPELTLVDVARGAYAGVTLAWPDTPATIAERVQRLSTAHLVRREREYDGVGSSAGW